MAVTRGSPGLRAGTPAWVVAAYVGGLVLVFLGERVVSTVGWLRWTLTGVGLALVFALTVVRWVATGGASGQRRAIERALALLSSGGLLAILLYLTTTDPLDHLLRLDYLQLSTRHRYEALITVLWVALVLGTVVPMLFAERALFPMRRSVNVEWRRVREALISGVTLSMALVYGALFTYAAGELDWKADFSYFHTARPSESTRKIAASATEPIEVRAFFPQLNQVGIEAGSYLRDLARGLPAIHAEVYDRLLFPDLARKSNVFDDGVISVARGAEHESITLGTDINTARPKLKSLDTDFQKALLKVLRSRRTAYFTVGHGELNDTQPTPQNEGRTGRVLRELLEHQNYLVRDLSAVSGLAADVPEDATMVIVLGPKQAFLPEEVATLERYAARGGRLLLALDPESKIPLDGLAGLAGLRVSTALLANDKIHLRRRFNDSDNLLIATNRFSSHASVSTLSRIASRPVIFGGAGALDPKAGGNAGFHVDFAVRAMPDTYSDDNGNFVFDSGEKRQNYALVAAVTKAVPADTPRKKNDEMRAFVIGDSDAVSDALLGNEANVLLVADAVRWLGGEESFAGALATPEDVRISHTKQKDLVWFYGTIFAAPALVLGLGLLYARRTRRSRRPTRQPKPPGGPVPDQVTA